MDAHLTCHDIAHIEFRDIPDGIYRQLVQTYPSYIDSKASGDVKAPTVSIKFTPNLTLPEGTQYISSIAAYDDSSYFLFDQKGSMIKIDMTSLEDGFKLIVSPDIGGYLLQNVIETLLHTLTLKQQKAFFHSSGVGVDGQAVILCGWANIGKTESMVEFLRRGYAYIGDDWTILGADGKVYSYDKAIAMYPHDIAEAPEFVQAYYGEIKGRVLSRYCQLFQPSKVENITPGLRERITRRALRELVRRWHLRTNIQVRAEQITTAGALTAAPLKAVYFLSRANTPDIDITPISANELISRMLPCYHYEVRLFMDPEPFKFAFPDNDYDLGLGIRLADVESIWSRAFSHVQAGLFKVMIPKLFDSKNLVSRLEAHLTR